MSTALATRGYLCHRASYVLPGPPSIAGSEELLPIIVGGSESDPPTTSVDDLIPVILGAEEEGD